MKTKILKFAALMLVMAGSFSSCNKGGETVVEYTDLPWLNEKIQEIIDYNKLGGPQKVVAFYQCSYDDGKIGIWEDHDYFSLFWTLEGESPCSTSEKEFWHLLHPRVTPCAELNIDFENKILILEIGVSKFEIDCQFQYPMKDLKWLNHLDSVFVKHNIPANIFQCIYKDDKIGFYIEPLMCSDPAGYLCSCDGVVLYQENLLNAAKLRQELNFRNLKLIWKNVK